jgi:hypothetical protein
VFSTKPYWRIGSKRIQKKKEKAKLVPVENIRKAATQHTLPLPFWVRHIDPSIPFLPYSPTLFFLESSNSILEQLAIVIPTLKCGLWLRISCLSLELSICKWGNLFRGIALNLHPSL